MSEQSKNIKFDATQKMMIKMTDLDNYTAFYCPVHKLSLQRNDCITNACVYSACQLNVTNIHEEVKSLKQTL